MLRAAWVQEDPRTIDFAGLPRVPSEHQIISDVRAGGADPKLVDKVRGGVNQHNYLIHDRGRFWIMWSDGPGVEDRVGQRVKFTTSTDAKNWEPAQFLTPVPTDSGPDSPYYGTRTDKGFRWIARGFWKRGDDLLALASLDEAAGFFGKSLALHAFRWDDAAGGWKSIGVISDNTINNFPPDKTPDGKWMMSRRMYDYKDSGVHFLVGGITAIDDWESFPVLGSASELAAEEPLWWTLPDGRLAAMFRDNRKSGFLYRSLSSDNGRTWSKPVKTNFPDAASKLHGFRLADGRYVLVSNANPKMRDPLVLSLSDDGLVFNRMGYLVGGRRVDYPHSMEHEGRLYVAFSGGKQTVELLTIELEKLREIDQRQ
ncbi:MAG: exo-alpha-sialidase [Planctomycetaceae bacterium]|nr:exo-alpha-sialidase [Planctomycetaceae bacterium]